MNGELESTSRGTLILGWGNPGRQDDGLGPALAAAIGVDPPTAVAVETDYQLQVEDAAEVARFDRVLFVDADRRGPAPYSLRRIEANDHRMSFSTHSVAPEAVLALSRDLFGAEPEAWLLGIRGYEFDDFGEGLSAPGAREPRSSGALRAGSVRCGLRLRREQREQRGRPMHDERRLILCIDDDPDILSFLEVVLEREGFGFLGAATAEEGLRLFKANAPDAVIVDLMMEEVDAGMNFARELRVLRSEIPIFMLSSVGDDFNLTADYSELGLAGIFQKPVSPETLAMVLRSALTQPVETA